MQEKWTWFACWAGLLVLYVLDQVIRDSKNEMSLPNVTVNIKFHNVTQSARIVIAALAAGAALAKWPLPWAAVVGLVVYILQTKVPQIDINEEIDLKQVLTIFKDPLPFACAAFSIACALVLLTLNVTAAVPVYLGAIIVFGTDSTGEAGYFVHLWLPIAVALAVSSGTRLYWFTGVLLAIAALRVAVGRYIKLNNELQYNASVYKLSKVLVFSIVLAFFQPFFMEAAQDGNPIAWKIPPCTKRDGQKGTFDAQGISCELLGKPCPLAFNMDLQQMLVCGGKTRGKCQYVEAIDENTCHCLEGYCGDIRYYETVDRFFYTGCAKTNLKCSKNGAQPTDTAFATLTDELNDANQCGCICKKSDIVGPTCNATCPEPNDENPCNNPYGRCIYNSTTGNASCTCAPGFQPPLCNSTTCNGHGIVDPDTNLCTCEPAYLFGPPGNNSNSSNACAELCSPSCGPHGTCLGNKSATPCACDFGWKGSLCTECDPNATDALPCGELGTCSCSGGSCQCTCPFNLDPQYDCTLCVDPNADPNAAKPCSECIEGYYLKGTKCAACDAACPFGCSQQATNCTCPEGLQGPQCQCGQGCTSRGGTCDSQTGLCDCRAVQRCVNAKENECGDFCETMDKCEPDARTSLGCCDDDTGACICSVAGASPTEGCAPRGVYNVMLDSFH